MDFPIKNTYDYFKVNERCKKLERTVKLLQLKLLENENTENCAPDTSKIISSMNGNAFDIACAHSSKLGSEIVSSSTNVNHLFAQKMNSLKNNNNIATSSVNNSPDNDPARTIMPSPKNIPGFNDSSRKNTLEASEASTSNSPIKYSTSNEKVQKSVVDIIEPNKIFQRWKVVINDQGQLIIGGINASIVQSCFNHIYELQGHIYDDKHELPEYIRKKFYNGFPDDWETVFQLWRSYISGGSKSSFKWPTPVTDTDEGFESNISQLSYSEGETLLSESSKITIENPKSPVQDVQNVFKESYEKIGSQSVRKNDTSVKVNSLLTKNRDQYSASLSTTNHTNDKVSLNVNKNNSNTSVTEKVPSREHSSNNSNVTPTKVENIQNRIQKDSSPRSIQNYDYNFNSTPKLCSSGCNVPSIEKIRRKLYKKDHESSKLSESDTEIQKRKSIRKVSKMNKNRKIARIMATKKRLLHRVNNDSDNDFVPKKVVYPSVRNVLGNKPVNIVHNQINEVDSEGFIKPMPKMQPGNISNNPMHTNLPPKQHHRQRKADSPSTITGFLTNYDSCVSISEDDRRVHTPRPKLDDKRTVNDIDGKTLSSFKLKLNEGNSHSYYDCSISLTEDEFKYDGSKMNEIDLKKQVFRQLLKRNLKHQLGNTKLVNNKNLQDYPVVEDQCSLTPSKESENISFSEHNNSADLNENKGNTSDQMENVDHSNTHLSENHQTNVNKLYPLQERIKPSIISVEEVSYEVDDLLLKTRKESTKNDTTKSKINKNGTKENNSLPIFSISNNISNATNSKFLELDLKMASKDVSVQPQDIKNTLKRKSRAEKNVNNDRSSGKFIFGSQENPKQLKSWFPNVIKNDDSTFGLIFEGQLLDEAGHVADKKFRTGFVIKRLSLKVIKTDENEFYELIGDLSDTKHVVPKELYKRCMNGCPGQIPNFCKKWMSIIDKFDPLNESMNSIDMTSVSQSSRGRRILPTLSYWSGERLSVKGDHSIYTPPKSFCTSFEISKKDRSLSAKKNLNNSTGQDKSKNLSQENKNIVNEQIRENNKELEESTEPKKKKEEIKLRKSNRKRKESVKASKLFKDSYSSCEEDLVFKRRRNV